MMQHSVDMARLELAWMEEQEAEERSLAVEQRNRLAPHREAGSAASPSGIAGAVSSTRNLGPTGVQASSCSGHFASPEVILNDIMCVIWSRLSVSGFQSSVFIEPALYGLAEEFLPLLFRASERQGWSIFWDGQFLTVSPPWLYHRA